VCKSLASELLGYERARVSRPEDHEPGKGSKRDVDFFEYSVEGMSP